jgi:hypothetical protein
MVGPLIETHSASRVRPRTVERDLHDVEGNLLAGHVADDRPRNELRRATRANIGVAALPRARVAGERPGEGQVLSD